MEFNFGVRGHDLLGKGSPEDLAKAVRDYGFSYVQLVFPKAFADHSYEDAYVTRVKKALDEQGVKVAMLGAYFNPVHSDPSIVAKGCANFQENLRISHCFGPFVPVGSETGSFNDSPWIYVPKNRTEEGYRQSAAVFALLAKQARQLGVPIAIEPAFGHVIYDVATLQRLFSELDSPDVYATIDLYNLLDASNFEQRDEIFHQALAAFSSRIKIIHLKDGRVIEGKLTQLAPGEGDFHYGYMLREIARYCPQAILVFEGVRPEKIRQAFSYLQDLAKAI